MDEIVKIINDWQNYTNKETAKDRIILNDIELKSKEVIDILGCRRVGKSTLFKLIAKKLELKKNQYLYINFEDPFFIENNSSQIIEEIIETFKTYFSKELKYLFFDEIQNIKNWERAIRKLRDLENYHIYISGSSSKLLSKELGSSLTGRHISKIIYPLSFREYLSFKKINYDNKKDLIIKKKEYEKYFKQYLENGGFPEIVINNDLELLKNYFYDILYKDIITRYEIRDTQNLEKIAYNLISNFTNKISYQSLRNNYNISFDKIKSYISYLVETYLIIELKQFNYSIKKQENLSKKYYVIDNGFIKSIAFKFSNDLGKLLENLVLIELERQKKETYFYITNNGYEIDFLIKTHTNEFEIIQVSYDLNNEKTKKREIRAIVEASKELNCTNAIIITNKYKEEIEMDNLKINCVPIVEWLLTKSQH